jgi:hypothetical protein
MQLNGRIQLNRYVSLEGIARVLDVMGTSPTAIEARGNTARDLWTGSRARGREPHGSASEPLAGGESAARSDGRQPNGGWSVPLITTLDSFLICDGAYTDR